MFVERKEYNNVITVKLVIPSRCNASCPFCYNKGRDLKCDRKSFLENFIPELSYVLDKVGDKNPVSLDITGGEPTADPAFLIRVLEDLRVSGIRSRFLRATMTTNGSNLTEDVIGHLKGIVDYVNISVHDYREDERRKILGLRNVEDSMYKERTRMLSEIGITSSVCAVIHKEIQDFPHWRDSFVDWAKSNGFISVRFRCDVFWSGSETFDRYLSESKEDPQFKTITYEKTPDSHWLRLRRHDGMRVFFLHGVLDTSEVTKGIEYVVDTDGKCYCDYYRKVPIREYNYEIGKIYDKETCEKQ